MDRPNELENTGFHDRFLRKNQALSRAYDIENRDKAKAKDARGEIKPVTQACSKCKQIKPCQASYVMETGHFDGAVSVSKNLVYFCDDCSPRKKYKDNEMSKKQILALMRGAKKF